MEQVLAQRGFFVFRFPDGETCRIEAPTVEEAIEQLELLCNAQPVKPEGLG